MVKPSVSAGGRSTARYAASDPAGLAHIRALHQVGQTVMVQGYLAAIDTEGEADLIFIDGVFSHAVRKEPALQTGEGIVVDHPWDRMAWSGLMTPSVDQLAVAGQAMEVVERRFEQRLVYGRVDLVSDGSGTPLVLEVELIDPYLSLDEEPEGATRLAAASAGTDGRHCDPLGRRQPGRCHGDHLVAAQISELALDQAHREARDVW